MDENLSKKLAALRTAYARTLPKVAVELEAAVTAWVETSDGAEVRRLSHRLVGTSGSYGLSDVSASARALEELTGAPPDAERARAACARVVEACRVAAQ